LVTQEAYVIYDAEHDFGVGNAQVPSDLREEPCQVPMIVSVGVFNAQDFMFCNYSPPL